LIVPAQKKGNIVAIPVFYGMDKEDPEAYMREFKRSCMANGDCKEALWLQVFPDFLEEAAHQWYMRQSAAVKGNWKALKKAFILEFQSKESYQSLLGLLSSVMQEP
jgi:hypothetical protein